MNYKNIDNFSLKKELYSKKNNNFSEKVQEILFLEMEKNNRTKKLEEIEKSNENLLEKITQEHKKIIEEIANSDLAWFFPYTDEIFIKK